MKLIHHIAPISPVSYDLFFLLGPWTKAKYILGPAMIPPDNSNPNDFGTVLGVKKSLSVRFLWIGYQITVPILRFLAIQTFKKSDNLITVTSEGKKYYDSFLNPQKVEVIPVGVSNYFNVENKKLKSNKTVTIVSASRLTERKGIDIILTAFYNVYKTHKNIRLKIVGTGEQYEELKELVKKLKLKNVVNFVGFVPNNEMVNHYKSADIFITATRHEPFGMSIIEAMCCGLPILSSNVNALKVIIGEGGIVVEKDNVIAFSENLEKLVVDLKLRKKLGLNASRLARENYIWDKIVKRYLKLAER